jgi:acrylyl-CoA reductase (NADPH)
MPPPWQEKEEQMRAIVAPDKGQQAVLTEVEEPRPDAGEVLIEVTHSSINYKDGAAMAARPGIVRRWPVVLGIDAVGEVVESRSERFAAGDRVVLNGAGAGETRDGGYASRLVAPSEYLVHVPQRISSAGAAAIGTAGFTAAIGVLAVQDHGLAPGDGEVLVTGAAGGVGSVAISLLAGRGYAVVASTGRAEQEGDYLSGLGARRIIDRAELSQPISAPLQTQRWAAVLDGIGSHTLANALAQTRYGGVAVSYGLAQGADLPTTVVPFILRAVTLTGANSVDARRSLREAAWALLADELDLGALDAMTTTVGFSETLAVAPRILDGQVRGRTVVDLMR